MGSSPRTFKELCESLMVIGGLAALDHYLISGRWMDEDKDVCHGKYGLVLFGVSLFGRLLCE